MPAEKKETKLPSEAPSTFEAKFFKAALLFYAVVGVVGVRYWLQTRNKSTN